MEEFLRTVRQSRWYKYPAIDWLAEGELQGDALSDINTQNGKLSVYRINDEDEMQHVIVALAATKENMANLDYILFDDYELSSFGITVIQSDGNTASTVANELHYELGNLSASRLVRLAQVVSVGRQGRIPEQQIRVRLQKAADDGHLDKTRIKFKKMRDALQW